VRPIAAAAVRWVVTRMRHDGNPVDCYEVVLRRPEVTGRPEINDVGSVRREGRWGRLVGLVGVVVVEVGGPLGEGPRVGVVGTDGPGGQALLRAVDLAQVVGEDALGSAGGGERVPRCEAWVVMQQEVNRCGHGGRRPSKVSSLAPFFSQSVSLDRKINFGMEEKSYIVLSIGEI